MLKQIGSPPPRTPRSPSNPQSPSGLQHRGTYTVTFKFSQTMVFLLGLTYITIMLLSPFIRTRMTHASLLSLEGWNLLAANATAEALKTEISSSKPCQYPKSSSISSPSKNILPNPNRTIALIHVGKAGGVSLRRMTIIYCKLFFIQKLNYTREKVARKTQRCIDDKFPDPKAVLAHQTKNYFHIESYDDTELATSTSFLVTLRNPVDRIISTYRYAQLYLSELKRCFCKLVSRSFAPWKQILTSRVTYISNCW
jgi:Sulfotransferase family